MNLRQLPLTKLGEDNLHYNTAAAAIKSWPTANTVARATAFHKATTMQLDERRLHCGECDRSKPYEDAAWVKDGSRLERGQAKLAIRVWIGGQPQDNKSEVTRQGACTRGVLRPVKR